MMLFLIKAKLSANYHSSVHTPYLLEQVNDHTVFAQYCGAPGP